MVFLILIDGTRPDALSQADCPHLSALIERSAYTLQATAVMPSLTLPCHMSIFHSVPPSRHGVLTNEWTPMARPLPGLIEQARAAGRQTAFFYGWEPLRNLSRPDSLTLAYCHNSAETDLNSDQALVDEVIRFISRQPTLDFAFVYLGTVDTAGHRYGWLSAEYLAQLAQVDAALGRLLAAMPAGSTVLLQSDHGGHDRTHGTAAAEDMTIPWLVSGPGIRRNVTLTVPVSLLDTAPTLARLLDLEPHPAWEGRCVTEIFG